MTYINGEALRQGAQEVLEILLELVAGQLEASVDDRDGGRRHQLGGRGPQADDDAEAAGMAS